VKLWCLALALKDAPALVAEYRRWHEPGAIWPEVISNIRESGILKERIFLLGTRMVMVLETTDDFSFEKKAELDRADPKMREWELLMDRFQERLPQATSGAKWAPMELICEI